MIGQLIDDLLINGDLLGEDVLALQIHITGVHDETMDGASNTLKELLDGFEESKGRCSNK